MCGSFTTSCAMLAGTDRFEMLVFALFIISVSSCIALILDAKRRVFHSQQEFSKERLGGLFSFVRLSFGASLAAAFLSAFSQSTVKVAEVFSLTLFSSGLLCSILLTCYLMVFHYLIIAGQGQTGDGYSAAVIGN